MQSWGWAAFAVCGVLPVWPLLVTDAGDALDNTGCAGMYRIPARSSRRPADGYTVDPPPSVAMTAIITHGSSPTSQTWSKRETRTAGLSGAIVGLNELLKHECYTSAAFFPCGLATHYDFCTAGYWTILEDPNRAPPWRRYGDSVAHERRCVDDEGDAFLFRRVNVA
jgi:hypothetical protein